MKRLAPMALLLLAGCHQNLTMTDQPKGDEWERSSLFANGRVVQTPPTGTVATDADTRDLAAQRPPMSLALVKRGQQRFDIYCSVCHGYSGDADGMVVQRGFPRPPSFHSPRLIAAPDSHFVDVITNGHGVMYSYADRVPVPDRWAITAYIRALQKSRMGSLADAPLKVREELVAERHR
jgi:mono/diheme cytochrome c family protein